MLVVILGFVFAIILTIVFVLGFILGRTVGISAERLKNTKYPSNAMLHNDKLKIGPKVMQITNDLAVCELQYGGIDNAI
jgi:hypothetical protein